MSCRVNFRDRVLFTSRNPPTVIVTKEEHIGHLQRKPDGHYEMAELMPLVEDGRAVLYSEEIVTDVLYALPTLFHGCSPAP
jgi:hypothetical protein